MTDRSSRSRWSRPTSSGASVCRPAGIRRGAPISTESTGSLPPRRMVTGSRPVLAAAPRRRGQSRRGGRRTQRPPAVYDVARRVLVGHPRDGGLLAHTRLRPIAHAGRERVLELLPLSVRELDGVVGLATQRYELAPQDVRPHVLARDHRRRGVARLELRLLAHLAHARDVDLLDTVDIRAAVLDVGRLVLCDLLLTRHVAVVRLHRAQPAVHRQEALGAVVRIAYQRRLAEPDHVVLREVALDALEPRPDRPRPVGVVERTGIGPTQVDDREVLLVVRLVHRTAAVRIRD